MKERNKGVDQSTYGISDMDCYYSTASELPCKKHPSSSSVGICAHCLKDRLVKLVCSDCGEQRLSSCSCSDEISSSHRNSCTVEVGSVGRVSFLIENEKSDQKSSEKIGSPPPPPPIQQSASKAKEKEEEVVVLRRSSSNCVEIKRRGKFWRIGRFFGKKNKEKDYSCGRSVGGGFDEKNEMWMMMTDQHNHGVSRSRSLCSFRGGAIFGSEDGGDSLLSGARSSISAARSSGVNLLESGRRSGYSEAEPRRSGFDVMDVDGGGFYGVNRRVFSLRESDFKGMDESSFIDLKLDYSSESTRPEFSAAGNNNNNNNTLSAFGSARCGGFVAHESGGGGGGLNYAGLVGDGFLTNGGSCRITVNDRGIKSGRKSMKGWRWIFRYNSNRGSARKRDEDLMYKT